MSGNWQKALYPVKGRERRSQPGGGVERIEEAAGGVRGTVVCLKKNMGKVLFASGGTAVADAGVMLPRFAVLCALSALSGAGGLGGIPGPPGPSRRRVFPQEDAQREATRQPALGGADVRLHLPESPRLGEGGGPSGAGGGEGRPRGRRDVFGGARPFHDETGAGRR